MRKAFSLIEVLVVVTIIGLITAVAVVSYSQFLKEARDSKRKADLEQIRGALEMYRSANGYYPTVLSSLISPNKYIEAEPTDPKKDSGYSYQYVPTSSTGTSCDNSSTLCTVYVLGARVEGTSTCTSPPASTCGPSSSACNYCMTAYGKAN